MGRPVPIRAGVGASGPAGGGVCACGRTGGFSLAPQSPSDRPSKQSSAPWGCKPYSRTGVGASSPAGGRGVRLRAHWGLSSGQTIGAARTAVRSACCLPELRVANRLRRLCPLGTRFPSFPPVPFGSPTETIERPIGLQALSPRRSRRVRPRHGGLLSAKASPNVAGRGLSARPLHPLGLPPK